MIESLFAWLNGLLGEGTFSLGDGYAILGDYYFRFPEKLPQLTPLSFAFILFVFLVFCLARPFKGKLRPFVLLAADLFFLYSFSTYHLGSLLFLALLGWLLALLNQLLKNKWALLGSILVPVVILGTFKFAPLFGQSILMPLGLSFVTFKIISAMVDAYKGEIDVRNPLVYFNYALFFPAVTAGPIHRYAYFKDVLTKDQPFDYSEAKNGGFQMMLGMFEKIVFCDFIASVVTRASAAGMTGGNTLLAIILYSFQIYLDFDAYSNISIGCAKLLGFSFPKNFNTPYLAATIKEFWRRWHISLGSFFRDYVYIPLGGSRKGKVRQYLAILAVFLLSGIWHGSTMNFVWWGLGHGILQIIEELILSPFRKMKLKKPFALVFRIFGILINFLFVTILWQLFKYSDMGQLAGVWQALRTPQKLDFELMGLTANEVKWLFFILITVIVTDILRDKWDMVKAYSRLFFPLRWLGYAVLIQVFLVFGVFGGSVSASDFIYQWF